MTDESLSAAANDTPGRLRRIAPKLGVLVGTVVLLLLAGELAVRSLTEIGPLLIVRDSRVGKRYVPNFDDRVFVPEAGKTVALRFNREGFRGPNLPYEKPEGVRRVAVIGDSMTVLVATEEDRTWVAELQRLLTLTTRNRWEVMNFGVSSASTGQELVLYQEVVARYQPDIVVLALFVGNDVTDNSRRLTQAPRIYFELADDGVRRLPYSTGSGRLSAWANQHSRLYVWYRTSMTLSRARLRQAHQLLETRHLVFRTDEPGDLAHAWELTGRLISVFAREVEARGSHFVLAVLPTGPQIYDDLWSEIREAGGADAPHFDPAFPEKRLRAICEDEGIPCVALLERMRREAKQTSGDSDQRFFYDHGRRHFNDAGNAIAAEIVADFLGASTDLTGVAD